jgi:phosphoribosylamine--glycine ligase
MHKIAVIGAGGREHALAWKLAQSPEIAKVFVLPGNDAIPNSVAMDVLDFPTLAAFCVENGIEALVVGSEAPLVAGMADYFHAHTRIKVFGPDRCGARLEGSKIWAKQFMSRYGVQTAAFRIFERIADAWPYIEEKQGRCVIKYDGLAAGKGVFVCGDLQEAKAALQDLERAYGQEVSFLVEERLVGDEISIMGLVSGQEVKLFHSSQDHKQLLDGDQGPNTGGMGAFCPVPFCGEELLEAVMEKAIRPTLKGLAAEGIYYNGFLYFGFMITHEGPFLLEYNARLGDPETEVLLPSLETDLWVLIEAALAGRLAEVEVKLKSGYFVDVVLAAEGYPQQPKKGAVISGLDQVPQGVLVFHAGTKKQGEDFVVNGGRVLNIVGQGERLDLAIQAAYAAVQKIYFDGMQYRKDIGQRVYKVFQQPKA